MCRTSGVVKQTNTFFLAQAEPALPLAFDPNALNALAATLLGPVANAPVQQVQPVQPRPMFRDPRAGPTVPLDLPPELAMELQRLRGGPAVMPHGNSRRNKWDVVG